MKRNPKFLILAFLLGIAVLITLGHQIGTHLFGQPETIFDGQRAYLDVLKQHELGPRIPGSPAHAAIEDMVRDQLQPYGWSIEVQSVEYHGHTVRNIIAKRGQGSTWILLGAHYDSRQLADATINQQQAQQPVPGANDGASGVAVLLELGRTLPQNLDKEIWLVFLDLEDQGNLPGWDWILGSSALANSLDRQPSAVIIIDMIGDADLNIHKEINSNIELTNAIWQTAHKLGYEQQFLPNYKYRMLDDHIPFIQKGIPAIDIIDFDYPYWHTEEDTPDKVSAPSLEAVGRTLWTWLTEN
jgi:Zn-dependent M28 family amino/carboxypeptidase